MRHATPGGMHAQMTLDGQRSAKVAGTTIPEHGRARIPLQTVQMGVIQIDGIESLSQSHRRSRFSSIRGALVMKTCRGDIT
jgi:hypothetical protein